MIKNLIFDFGNVLTRFDWGQYAVDLSNEEKLRTVIPEMVFADKCWKDYDAGIINETQVIELAKSKLDSRYHSLISEMIRSFPNEFKQYNEMVPLLEKIKSKGYSTYLLSNFPEGKFEEVAKKCPVLELIDHSVISAYVHMIKPDSRIFQYMIDKYDLCVSECLFIDDVKSNVDAALKLGMSGYVFKTAEAFELYLIENNIL